jgi:hypothetical protein
LGFGVSGADSGDAGVAHLAEEAHLLDEESRQLRVLRPQQQPVHQLSGGTSQISDPNAGGASQPSDQWKSTTGCRPITDQLASRGLVRAWYKAAISTRKLSVSGWQKSTISTSHMSPNHQINIPLPPRPGRPGHSCSVHLSPRRPERAFWTCPSPIWSRGKTGRRRQQDWGSGWERPRSVGSTTRGPWTVCRRHRRARGGASPWCEWSSCARKSP